MLFLSLLSSAVFLVIQHQRQARCERTSAKARIGAGLLILWLVLDLWFNLYGFYLLGAVGVGASDLGVLFVGGLSLVLMVLLVRVMASIY